MFALAHLSDPHLAAWSAGGPAALMNKRITGFLSWVWNRRKIHLPRVLGLLLADLKSQHPDHVALTGDIINISALDEYIRARAWLASWADPRLVSVIPGNHDAYVPVPWGRGLGLWAPYMTSWRSDTDAPGTPQGEVLFPYTRILGEVAIIGVSSAIPTLPFVAAGRVGQDQMQRLRMTLSSLRGTGLFRIVLIHHPPFPMPLWHRRKALLDADAFGATLSECGAELVLHGHTHMAAMGRIGEAPVIGVPSASARPAGHKDAAAYNIYRIGRDGPHWRVTTEVRGLVPDGTGFESKGHFSFDVGSPVHA